MDVVILVSYIILMLNLFQSICNGRGENLLKLVGNYNTFTHTYTHTHNIFSQHIELKQKLFQILSYTVYFDLPLPIFVLININTQCSVNLCLNKMTR